MSQHDHSELIARAYTCQRLAYAPYSHFAVGAAVQTESGAIFAGCNIENASYPLGICAERVAIFSAYAAGERTIHAIAIVTPTENVARPCGACRQVLIELAPNSTIILLNRHGAQEITTPQALLPHPFLLSSG